MEEAKMKALEKYLKERRLCKNPDMTPFEPSSDATTAFLCGWDAAKQNMSD